MSSAANEPSATGPFPVDGAHPRALSPGEISLVVLAVLACGAAVTVLGQVLQPFLVAVFLFYATRFGAKSLARLGMSSWAAYTTLIGLILIGSILLAQFVYREASVFQKTWPRYEDRIAAFLIAFSPANAVSPRAGSANLPTAADAHALPDRFDTGTEPEFRPSVADTPNVDSDPDSDDASAESSDRTGTEAELPERTPDLLPRSPGSHHEAVSDTPHPTAGPKAGSPPRTSLTDLFRLSSNDVVSYVFSHGFDVAELIVMVFFYLVFLFLGSRKLEGRVLRAFPGAQGERVVAIGQGISESMERFMVVKTLVGLGMGISSGLLMYLFGLDHWLLWAFLFFAANYITYIGSMAACVAPMMLAYLDLDSPVAATVLAILIVANRTFWIDYLEVRMSGRQLNLDPTLLFLWLAYWGWAWGILGLILAYPMMAAVKISLWHLGGARGWALLLSDE